MSLNSFSFIIYFAIVVIVMAIFQLIRKKSSLAGVIQLCFLLAFSYFFILKSDWQFCICVLAVTLLAYLFARLIERKHTKIILGAGIFLLVSFLAYFKYTNFFVNSFRSIAGLDSITLNIILPIGISFYIFSALSYLIDVYRGDYLAEKNIVIFALYIAFFPKLTAGPIVRGKDFFPQVKEYRGIEWEAFKAGIEHWFRYMSAKDGRRRHFHFGSNA